MTINKDANFGFQKVTSKEKRNLVDNLFSNVSGNYDLMNDLISLGIHRTWKNELCKMLPNLNSKIIDVAGGTGDISVRIFNKAKKQNCDPHIVVADINPDMLKICKDRAIDKNILNNIDFVVADAENLPFPDNSFDYYIIAFGIRNMLSMENSLSEAYRILKPTGKFLCLEFSKVENDFISKLYNLYSFNIIPRIGHYITNNKDAYQYLAESINLFPNQEDFKTMIQDSGFSSVNYKNLFMGIASIHYGFKI